jgi:LL-diaminopimelate aminotransferase
MRPPAQRMNFLSPHYFATLNSKLTHLKAEGKDVIRLDEGSPDLPPADHIIQALTLSASQPDRHGYQPHRGTEELRAAWAEMYRREYKVEVDAETEILPLLGSKEGIFHLIQAYIEPGDVVLVQDPGYVTYRRGTLFAGGETYSMPLLRERDYLPDLEAIPAGILERARMMWLNYPHNPTAAIASLDFFEHAVELARDNDLLLCHDAVYTQVTFNGFNAPSLLQIPGAKDIAVEFNTLSKSHNMAGWRTGVLVGNQQVVKTLYTLKTNVDSSHFLPILDATTAALRGDQSWIRKRNDIYRQRRDLVIQHLHTLGLPAVVPDATLYVWCPVPTGWECEEFTIAALENAWISLTPGTVFGQYGQGFVRISLTAPLERIETAMDRLTNWVVKL